VHFLGFCVMTLMVEWLVGWLRFEDEGWKVTGQRMKAGRDAALWTYPVQDFQHILKVRAVRFAACALFVTRALSDTAPGPVKCDETLMLTMTMLMSGIPQ